MRLSLKSEHINGGLTCCERNIEIARNRGWDMTGTNLAYPCDSTQLIIPEGDYNGLTEYEIAHLEPYIPPPEPQL